MKYLKTMKQIGEIITTKMAGLTKTSCEALLPALPAERRIKRTVDGCELSLYDDQQIPETVLAMQVARLKVAFPRMERHFFDMLAERIVSNNFTEKRLIDAVNNIIDNFKYKELNIADIISFDRRVKLHTGYEYVNAQTSGIPSSEFERREIDGTIYWVRKVDLLNAKL
jgi:hypothetical protein